MFDKLLPAIENTLLQDSGSVPVIFEGMEHIIETKETPKISSSHATHELLYVRSGKINFFIDGKTITLDKGNTILIKPYTEHYIKVSSGTADTYVLYFGFSRPKDNSSLAQPSFESFLEFASGEDENGYQSDNKPYVIISGKYKKSISNIVERIVDEKSNIDISSELMIKMHTVELMIILSRALKREWEDSLMVKNGKARELVSIAKSYIDENYDRGITVADAASYVYLSQGYFTRAFRDEYSMSPMNYLMQKRIERACELLAKNEIKVSGVAIQAGFSSPQRFNVAFRKQMGMTPLDYRKVHGA